MVSFQTGPNCLKPVRAPLPLTFIFIWANNSLDFVLTLYLPETYLVDVISTVLNSFL